jgi:hypothetical protein
MSCSNELPPVIPFWAPILCAIIASAVRGMTGFADGLCFQALWAFLTASSFVPTSCGALRKAVLYSTIMQAVTLPIQVWATRNHLRALFAYIASMSFVGSTTVFVGAALLYSDAALKLRIFAGVFFCFVSAVQLTAGAVNWLEKLAEQVEAGEPANAVPEPSSVNSVEAISLELKNGESAKQIDNINVAFAPALSSTDASYQQEADNTGLIAEDGTSSSFSSSSSSSPSSSSSTNQAPPAMTSSSSESVSPEFSPDKPEDNLVVISSTNPILLWFASPQGVSYFPVISPVLSPAPLLAVLCSAALCAGVLNGMIGAGGPPMMLVYSFINLDKDILRGFGIVPSVFMVLRFIAYVAYPGAVFDIQGEWILYISVGVASGVGSQAGNYFRQWATGPSLMRAILALVWLSGGSMLEALGKPVPAAIFFSLTALWLFALAVSAAIPLTFRRFIFKCRGKTTSDKTDSLSMTIPGQKRLVIGASVFGTILAIIAIVAASVHLTINSGASDIPIA